MRYILSLLLVLGSTTLASAQDLAGAKKFFDQSHLPTVSSTAPTNGQVLTWDSTLGKAKWAAGGGGGGSFDPAAATAITFTTGLTTPITGPTDTPLVIQSGVNGSGIARSLDLFGANGGAATKSGADVNLHAGSGNTSGSGGDINITTGNGGNTSGSGGDIYLTCGSGSGTAGGGWQYFYTGDGGSTSNASGSFYFSTGGVTDGNSGDFEVNLSDAYGTNRNGGVFRVQLAAGSGSGENGSFYLRGSGGATIFKVAYDGTVTGPTESDMTITSAPGRALYLVGASSEVQLRGADSTGSDTGADASLFAGQGGTTGQGGSNTIRSGQGGTTSGPSGGIALVIGNTTDGNTGSIDFSIPTPSGTNRSAGQMLFHLGNKTGSGTAGSFVVQDAAFSDLFKIAYDGTVTGPTGAAFNVTAATSQNLNLTAPNQILFNSAGDYMRMGNAFLNLSSAGGLAFCTESTATTIGTKLTYQKANYGGPDYHYWNFTTDLTGSEADEPAIIQAISVNNPGNLVHSISMQMINGAGTILAYSGGGWASPASLQLAAGGTSLTVYDSSNALVLSHTRLDFGSGGPQIRSGSGSPESSVTAPVGSVYLRTGGGASTTFYVKESGTGNTGWVAK